MYDEEPAHRNITRKIIDLYIKKIIKKKIITSSELNDKATRSLYASSLQTDKLYFWQLYNLLGEEVITNIISRFYEKILLDSEHAWFSDVFRKTGSLEYHVIGQKRFWMECMGGGHYYKNGKKTLYKKHSKVNEIMTSQGATLWVEFLYKTLEEYDELKKDKRVIQCIKDFVIFFMIKYGRQFSFKFRSKL